MGNEEPTLPGNTASPPEPAPEPAPEPVIDAAPEPTPEPTPEPQPEPVEKSSESLLSKKPDETVAQVEEKLEETPPEPVVEEFEPLTYEAFTFPEDVTPDEDKVTAFSELLGKYRVPQEEAQRLVDMYVADQQALVDRLSQHQHDVWRQTNENWVDQIKKDREIGGNRLETVLTSCADVIDRFASSSRDPNVRAAAQTRLRDALDATGAGNHPDIVRFLANVAQALSPPQPIVPPRAMPVAPQSRANRRYSNGAAHA